MHRAASASAAAAGALAGDDAGVFSPPPGKQRSASSSGRNGGLSGVPGSPGDDGPGTPEPGKRDEDGQWSPMTSPELILKRLNGALGGGGGGGGGIRGRGLSKSEEFPPQSLSWRRQAALNRMQVLFGPLAGPFRGPPGARVASHTPQNEYSRRSPPASVPASVGGTQVHGAAPGMGGGLPRRASPAAPATAGAAAAGLSSTTPPLIHGGGGVAAAAKQLQEQLATAGAMKSSPAQRLQYDAGSSRRAV